MSYTENPDPTACLRCGHEIQYDWMACPECGWKSTDPIEEVEDGLVDEGDLHTTGLSGSWVKWVAWVLIGGLAFLILMGLF